MKPPSVCRRDEECVESKNRWRLVLDYKKRASFLLRP